jgi:hypothetical protein
VEALKVVYMRNIGGGGFSKMAVVSYELRTLAIKVCLFLSCDDVFSSTYFHFSQVPTNY